MDSHSPSLYVRSYISSETFLQQLRCWDIGKWGGSGASDILIRTCWGWAVVSTQYFTLVQNLTDLHCWVLRIVAAFLMFRLPYIGCERDLVGSNVMEDVLNSPSLQVEC